MHDASYLAGTGSQLFVQVFSDVFLQVRMYDHFDIAGILHHRRALAHSSHGVDGA